jgi:aspartate racemase
MSDIAKHITDLSVEKRQLLDRYLKSAGLNLSRAVIIPQSRDTNRFALSFAQQRLWFLDQLEPHRAVYNIPDSHCFDGPLNLAALERSLSEIVRRHEILRTTFQTVAGEPVQVIAAPQPLRLEVTDLSHLPAPERKAEAQRLANEEAQQPFDLARGPLLRVQLLRLGEAEHVLLLTMHHIISDGWSIGVLEREWTVLYAAFSAGQSSPLAELAIQYADFAVWQREWLRGEVLEEQLGYWREQLGGELPMLELPTDRPRPAMQSYRGAEEALEFSEEVSRRLQEVGRAAGATLFMTLLAAFNVLLWRYSRQDEIIIGTPIANRNRAETEELIGFFVNTLVLRTKLSGGMSFLELLEQVRETTLGAYGHQDVPFEKLVEELQPERSLSRQPVFQVMFTLQDAEELKLAGLELSWMETESDITKFDLSLFISKTNAGLYSWFQYNTDLFERSTIARLLKHFQTLLEGIAANPEARLWELPLLTEPEQQMLADWNETQREYPHEVCIHELFERQAALRPEVTALVFADQEISYRELDERANQLARYLRAKGVGAESPVGVMLERGVELVVGLLAVLKAGGAYVPLDPTYPRERLHYMTRDAGLAVLLTTRALAGRVSETEVQLVCVDEQGDEIAAQRQEAVASGVSGENLAYVIYTSGSTGQPKGVAVTHSNVLRLVCGNNYADFNPAEVFLQLAPVSFDASTFELWGSLLHGARLVVMPPQLPSTAELAQALRQHGITTLWLTAGLFHLMVDEQVAALRGVRQLLAGGEALSVPHVNKLLSEPGGALINGYGPTETTTFACCHQVRVGDATGASIPIGRPIANTTVYLLDGELQPVPVGVRGELYIGGRGVARGYLQRPALTAERFVPDPFSQEPGTRLYRTGDLARYLSNGNIEFVGRTDQQVKVRGFRVELGEIEAVLNQYWAISESVVVNREDLIGGTRLIAYVVPEGGVEPTSSEMYTFLREKLPSYMLPSAFVTLEELPLTPNGKVDRRALPLPEQSAAEAIANFIAPRTALEETLAGIWRETLGAPQVGVESNFFDLGGHSLLATRVVSQIRERCGIELPLRVLFESPTVAGLARYLETAQPKDTELGRIFLMLENMENIPEDEVTALLALTESQDQA